MVLDWSEKQVFTWLNVGDHNKFEDYVLKANGNFY